MKHTGVTTETLGHVRLLKLDNPERKNALTSAIYETLIAELKAADRDEQVRALVLTGSPQVFCSGNDLDDFLDNPIRDDRHPVYRFMQQLNRFEKPVVAAVEGHAIGIGCTLLMHCDLVYAGKSSWFQMPFVHLGICPEFASTCLFPAMMGRQKAAELLLLGERFDVNAADAAGMINQILDDGEVLEVALSTAHKLAAAPPVAMKATKRLLQQAEQAAIDQSMRRELDQLVTALQREEFAQAVESFQSRRAAKQAQRA